MSEVVLVSEEVVNVIEVSDGDVIVNDDVEVEIVEVGIAGPQGIPGVAGGGFSYVHNQDVASTIWTVNHNLNGFPNVTVADTAGTVVEGDVVYVDPFTLTIQFTIPVSGHAYLS